MSRFPFDLNELPKPAYLVGGWVRDRLLGRQSKYLDIDFVLPDRAVAIASAIAKRYKAGFVVLDAERQIARVVFKNATADFAQQMGSSIREDLERRDFCMNAIAVSVSEDFQSEFTKTGILPPSSLLDPLDGAGDLAKKQVRMVAPENLLDDPLRILRAYRQAAQLGFEIEALTQKTLVKFSHAPFQGISQIAAERVRTELSYLLSLDEGNRWLVTAIDDGILEAWLPTNCLEFNRFARIDEAIALLIETFPRLEVYFANVLASDRTAKIITKLAALSNSATAMEPLGFSRNELRWLMGILRYLPKFLELLPGATPKQQYQLFQATLEIFPALCAVAIAHGTSDESAFEAILSWLRQWCDPQDAIAHPAILVTGSDLMTELALSPSPKIGELLESVRLAQVEGAVKDKAEAIAYAKQVLLKEIPNP
ncbi:CCA tRNA nucleotidyltransferase [Tumidithrix helvetica PCC 7403]|uniref:CCA tRNA nucleotidyltransferase n=1 Tax=Tumidithrix helvetica TaxID=3457545 RepID=UPI003CAC9EF8